MTTSALAILQKYWGYAAFRAGQQEIITHALTGYDTLALLPTGGGKSVCFQVPAIARGGLCLVISPLIALMKDQVQQLRQRGLKAESITSGMNRKHIDRILDNAVFGACQFLYVSPERLKTELFLARLPNMNITLLAIDEAHCISQWGYDFRPPYLQIADLRELLPGVPCMALTATAPPEVREDIKDKLNFGKGSKTFQSSFARSNLSYSAIEEDHPQQRLINILQKVNGTAVVYVRSRKQARELSDKLRQNKLNADFYHAGLSAEIRSRKQDDWIENKTRIIVATNAFGMGIDKADVRLVAHIELPESLEAYYQEAGRAGRDSQKAYAVILYNSGTVESLEKRTEQGHISPQEVRRVYQSVGNYLKIAVGSGHETPHTFELPVFCEAYNLSPLLVHRALEILENQGFLHRNQTGGEPSTLEITCGQEQLYDFQLKAPKYDGFIKMITRLYGGSLFSQPTFISETMLAQKLYLPAKEVTRRLLWMQQSGLVSYTLQDHLPKIVFTLPRYDARLLPLDVQVMARRKEVALKKAKAMVHYVTHPNRCRTALLLEYLGEMAKHDCGICDHCLIKKKQADSRKATAFDRNYILDKINDKPVSLQELTAPAGYLNKEELLQNVRLLLDSGELVYNSKGELKKNNT